MEIKLKLSRQASNKGFLVTLSYGEEDTDGFLPPIPQELEESLKNWQRNYRQWGEVRSRTAATELRITPGKIAHYEPHESALKLKTHLNRWLNSKHGEWQTIQRQLINAISSSNRNRLTPVLLDTKDVELRHLPWSEWNLFEDHGLQVEIVLRVRGRANRDLVSPLKLPNVRILVVVGRSDGISTEADLEVIQDLRNTKGAEVIPLIQPSPKELCDQLHDEQGYHIFVFTGHSGSQEDGQIGWIELNDRDSLTIEDFKYALKKAIKRGLQLAIFNSCDGLGLAHQLAELNLPQSIVMREPVPDRVAAEFLKVFFEEFTENGSLFASIHEARNRLEHFQAPGANPSFPGVVWLPTICLKKSALNQPLTWQELAAAPSPAPESAKEPISHSSRLELVVVAGLCFVSIGFLASIGNFINFQLFSGKPSDSAPLTIASPEEETKNSSLKSVKDEGVSPSENLGAINPLPQDSASGNERQNASPEDKEERTKISPLESLKDQEIFSFGNLGVINPLHRDSASETVEKRNVREGKAVKDVVAPPGTWRYGGSKTWAPVRGFADQIFQALHPKFDLNYVHPTTEAPGSETGIKMLLNNQLDFSVSSRPLTAEEKEQAQKQGFSLKQIPVAIDAIAIVVHPELNIPGLTLDQLKNIYTGNLTNWKQAGGVDLLITPYSRHPNAGGTVDMFVEEALQGEEMNGSVIEFVETTTEGLRKVAGNLGGVYYASAPEVVGQCTVKTLPLGQQAKQLVAPFQGKLVPPENCPEKRNQLNYEAFRNNFYPLTRELFVIVKQNNQEEEQAGEAYTSMLLSELGQKLVKRAGFTPISPLSHEFGNSSNCGGVIGGGCGSGF